jgi:hypothetical protein
VASGDDREPDYTSSPSGELDWEWMEDAMRLYEVIAVLSVCAGAACTTVHVQKVEGGSHPMRHVCIERNPKVAVADFVTVVEAGFRRHGIETEVFEGEPPPRCEYLLAYTATRGWDLAPYMDHAELWLKRGDEGIGYAAYRHAGGFGLNKFAKTKSKMDPVLDELLAGFLGQ